MKRKQISLGKTISLELNGGKKFEMLRVDMTWELDKPEDHKEFGRTLDRATNDMKLAIEQAVRALK